jgi:magnesium transporter
MIMVVPAVINYYSIAMLINCVAYQNGRKLADIPVDDVSEYILRPECFVWVALADPSDDEIMLMAEEFGLHELAVEDARKGHQRPKIEEYDGSLFVVAHTIEHGAPEEDDELIGGEVALFVAANYVLSIRRRTRKGFSDVRELCEREPELLKHGAGFVFYALIDAIVDRYFPIVDDLEEELEELEAAMFRGTPTRRNIEAFYALKQKLVMVKHAAAPLQDAVARLYGGRVPPMCVGLQDYFRDVYDHLVRVNADIENMRDVLQTATGVTLTLINLSVSEITKKLAAWGALITVPTLIAGIYGMNFEHMPELRAVLGYPLTLAAMVGIDAVLYWRLRRAKWL